MFFMIRFDKVVSDTLVTVWPRFILLNFESEGNSKSKKKTFFFVMYENSR